MKRLLHAPHTIGMVFLCALLAVPVSARAREISISQMNRVPLATLQAHARAGNVKAQIALGGRYYDGINAARNLTEAARWFYAAARAGNPFGEAALGTIYLLGHGVRQNDRMAFEWIQRAASKGHADAQGVLGALYASGQGTRQNTIQAYAWFTLSFEKGNTRIKGKMDELGRRFSPEDLRRAQILTSRLRKNTPKALAPLR